MSAVNEDIQLKEKAQEIRELDALNLTNLVVMPGVSVTCDVNGSAEGQIVTEIFNKKGKILLVTTKNGAMHPVEKDLFEFACIARVDRIELAEGSLRVTFVGEDRAVIEQVYSMSPFVVRVKVVDDKNAETSEAYRKMNELKKKCCDITKFEKYFPVEIEERFFYGNLSPSIFADLFIHFLTKSIKVQQRVLKEVDVEKRLDIVSDSLERYIGGFVWRKQIDDKVNANLSRSQKEMYLREQLRVINEELNGEVDEIEEMRTSVKAIKLPKDDEEKVIKEINRLSRLPFGSPEIGYIKNYIETILELPWNKKTTDNLDLVQARKVLDKEHYALDKVKDRIIENLAVMKLTGKVSGQILCLVGPPGVGKTSIARSIATAMGRKFVQVALGGVSDESVIRGHRRTYVGAMCGRILAGMKQAKTVNPVFLLDEIDKLTRDIKGDPSSALLEVLDPEQNNHFKDNFLEIPYDLSQVLFILTANTLNTIPRPLLDRMEVIELRSYTEIEKIQIAEKYLIPKQEKLCGLKVKTVPFTKELLSKIINEYTYEAGVRGLEREIGTICRKYAAIQVGAEKLPAVCENNLKEFLGNDFAHEPEMFQGGNVGEVVGLSVTSVGIGHTLLVEASVIPGDSKITLTGKQGQLMKESAQAAYSLVKSMAPELGLDSSIFSKSGLHIHIPHIPGGVEGPSAGIATTTAIVSAFTGRKVKEHLAMTGEVSLRGRVLAIGGVRDKLIAASRVGVKTIILPKDNEKDLDDLPKEIKKQLIIHLVDDIKQVLNFALE